MRILILTNHFCPENFRINDLARGMVDRGHKVTVVTGIPDYPSGRFHEGYGMFHRRVESWEGVRIVRIPLIPRGRGKSWNLVLNYLSSAFFFCLLAPWYGRGQFDVIFVFETSPVTIGLPAVLLKRLRKLPVVLWVLDLWPESLEATGAVRSPRILTWIRKLVRLIYRHCDQLLISSQGFVKSIEQTGGFTGTPVYFPNWVEPEYLHEPTGENSAEIPALPEGFRLMFAGNIGAAQDFETILAAAELLRNYADIQWIIFGEGRKHGWVSDEVKRRGLGQVRLLGQFPASTMPAFFDKADAMLLPLRNEPIFALTVPGKLQSYMARGKPVIASLPGEGADIVRASGCGLTCPPENPTALAEMVLRMYGLTPEQRVHMGEKGRSFCHEHFNRERLFSRLETILYAVTAGD